MSLNKSLRCQNSIRSIINGLHKKNITYAIARNYENFPDFGHDMDLYYDDDNSKIIEILISTARNYKWDIITQCEHWTSSKIKEHNITAFYFYNIRTNESLQIDLFSGFLVFGVPLMHSKDILKARQLSINNKFYTSNLEVENIFRILQIHKLSSNLLNESKILRYMDRIINYEYKYPTKISHCANGLGLYLIQNALNYLIKGKRTKFCLIMSLSKKIFLIQKLFVEPKKTFYSLLERAKEYYRLFISHPCGISISIATQNSTQKKFVEKALSKLVDFRIIPSWSLIKNSTRSLLQQKKILERGGVLIKFNDVNEPSDIALNKNDDLNIIYNAILKNFIYRHKIIYINK